MIIRIRNSQFAANPNRFASVRTGGDFCENQTIFSILRFYREPPFLGQDPLIQEERGPGSSSFLLATGEGVSSPTGKGARVLNFTSFREGHLVAHVHCTTHVWQPPSPTSKPLPPCTPSPAWRKDGHNNRKNAAYQLRIICVSLLISYI